MPKTATKTPPTDYALPLRKIDLTQMTRKPGSTGLCDHPDIKVGPEYHYYCDIFGGWFLGHFSEQWYGKNFEGWGTSGIQLDHIIEVYEVLSIHPVKS